MEKSSHRLSKMETQILREIAVLIQREIEDPRIKEITVTRVSMSADLKHAKVFFTPFLTLDDKQLQKLTYALNHSVSYLRRRIAENLKLRTIPELFFVYDSSLVKAENLVHLIDSLDTKK